MHKKLNVSLIALVVLSVCLSVFVFSSCICEKDKKSSSVQVEVYHPSIEGKIVDGRHYYMKYDGTPKVFEVKIYSPKEKKYLTNEDVVRKDLNSIIVVMFRKNEQTNSTRIDFTDANNWPTEVGHYNIAIIFNGFVVKEHELDPNYKGSGTVVIELHIEEEINNE